MTRTQRTRMLTLAMLVGGALNVVEGASAAQVYLGGKVDCGMWIDARSKRQALALEHYLLGLLNGMVMGSGIEFWRAKGIEVSREQVNLWMDFFCRSQPLKSIEQGAPMLYDERTDGAWSRHVQSQP